ncbi:uncharacterized protein LOC113361221 isoform X2 [Papaver somniferum]|uniref:uncharacterized protein LOC113361221 isoform X2 n=1 Tax=Papaver somniferum TaxID=3469 RepID=UPI000E6F62E5|nr:uncharacterized protein LOC113361221 isoform X2 [Papaver somniferum]
MVEYNGMKTLINALEKGVGHLKGKLIFGFQDSMYKELDCGELDDAGTGGISESKFLIDHCGSKNSGLTGLFKGVLSTFEIYKVRECDSRILIPGGTSQVRHYKIPL